jgi:hypothetical protein
MGDNGFKAFPIEVKGYQIGGFLIVLNDQYGRCFGMRNHSLMTSHVFQLIPIK